MSGAARAIPPATALSIPCLTCGYSLRGLPSGRCPECSAEHDQRYLATGQRPPRAARSWSARKALAVGRLAWSAAAAAWGALLVVAERTDVGDLAVVCGIVAGACLLRRLDLALRPGQVEALSGEERADVGVVVAAGGIVSVLIVLTMAALALLLG